MTVSGDIRLKYSRAVTFGESTTPRILSVDDFSFRRGRSWGTVLVDLEYHRLVDVLPDRSSETFAAWLVEHSRIEVVNRDRSGDYTDAVRRAAPDAIQVADRFHHLKNLGDVVLRVFRRRLKAVQYVPAPDSHHQRLTRLRLACEASRERTRAQIRTLFEPVHGLIRQGMNKSSIARILGITATPSRSTRRSNRLPRGNPGSIK